MAGRRSISVEPEDLAVASPRRSTRISISRTLNLDSPTPNAKKTDTPSEIKPAARRRRSQSNQEKSMTDIQKDVKAIAAKIPARRTSRRLSLVQEELLAIVPEIASTSKAAAAINKGKKTTAQTKTVTEEMPQKEEAEKSTNRNDEIEAGRPRRRVTRSMSTSPVNTKTQKSAYSSLALKKRILSTSDKLSTETKPVSLDIIKENEDEVTETSKDDKREDSESPAIVKKEEDVLSNKEIDISLKKTEAKDEIESPKSVEDHKEIAEKLEEMIESKVHKVEENLDEPDVISTKKKKKESCDRNVETSIQVLEKSIHNSYLSESVEVEDNNSEEKILQTIPVEEEIDISKEKIINISLVQDNKQINEIPLQNTLQDSGDSNISVVDIAENIISTPVQKERTPSTLEPLNNISNFELNVSKNKNVSSTPKMLEDLENLTPTKVDELEQNLSLVKDDGRTYSPIVKNVLFKHEELLDVVSNSIKEDNEDGNDEKLFITSNSEENLNISTRSPSSQTNTPKKSVDDSAEETKNLSNLNINKQEMLNTSTQSQNLKSTPKLSKSLSTDNSSSTSSSTSKKKEALAKVREQLLEDYIASFSARKRKRDESVLDDSSAQVEKKPRKSVKELDFSEDESNDEKPKNECIYDEAFEGSESTPSIDSNEIIFEGQSLNSSTSRDSNSADTYENDSFVAPDDETFDLMSGEENFLDTSPKKKKNKRIIENSSSSEEGNPNLDKMSMEGYGGLSPSIVSEKQISSIDSDLESVKRRNEDLSQQIEDGTFKHEPTEKKIDNEEMKVSDDEDVIVVETKHYSEEDSSSSASEEEIKKPEINVSKDSEEQNEEMCLKIDESQETEPQDEKEEEPEKDALKHKEILQIFFNHLNASNVKRKRRQTIDFANLSKIDKCTQTNDKRKRRESFGLEITEIMKEEALRKFEQYREAAQKDETVSYRRNSNYEVNSSGIYRVSPMREITNKSSVENEEELRMLKDFNNSLNENLEEVTQIKEGKVSKKQKRLHNKEEILDETIELGELFANEEMEKKTTELDETTETFVNIENKQPSSKKKNKKRKSLNLSGFEETENEEQEMIVDMSTASPKNRRSLIISDFKEIEEFIENEEEINVDVCKETENKSSPKRKKSLNISGFEEITVDVPKQTSTEETLKKITELDKTSEAFVKIENKQPSSKKKNKKRKSLNLSGFEETENEEKGMIVDVSTASPKNRRSLIVSDFKETEIEEFIENEEEINVENKSSPKRRKSLNISGFEEITVDVPKQTSTKNKLKKRKSLDIGDFEETENEELVDNKESLIQEQTETIVDVAKEPDIKGSAQKNNKKKKMLLSGFEETENEELMNVMEEKTVVDSPQESGIKKNKRKKSLNISGFEETENEEINEQQEEPVVDIEIKTSGKKGNKLKKSSSTSSFEETENEEIHLGQEETIVYTDVKPCDKKIKKNEKSSNTSDFKEISVQNEETVSEETKIKTKKKNKRRKSLNLGDSEEIGNKEQTILDTAEEFEIESSKKTNKKRKSLEMSMELPKKIFETIAFDVKNEINNDISPNMTKAKRRKQKKQRERSSSTSDSEIPILVPITEPVQKRPTQEKDNKKSSKTLKKRIKESLEEQISLVSSSDMILDVSYPSSSSFDEDSKYHIGTNKNINKKNKLYHSESSDINSPEELFTKLSNKNSQGFQIKNEQLSVSTSENSHCFKKLQSSYCYKNVIKPSAFGSAGCRFSVEDIPKVAHNKIKKHKNKQQSNYKDKLLVHLKNDNLKEQMLKSSLVKTVKKIKKN